MTIRRDNENVATAPRSPFTLQEYLERESVAEFRSEYVNGETFAMAEASRRHALIVTNLVAEIREKLRGRPCNVYSNDVRLQVPATGLYTYPDVMVTCGDEEVAAGSGDTILNPVLIVEVLSPWTRDYDRGEKFEHYRALPRLREYLTVAQSKPHAEQWVRQTDGRWLLTEHHGSAILCLVSIGELLGLDALYEKVSFGDLR